MYNILPFLAKFREERQKDAPLRAKYSERRDLHFKSVNGQRIPVVLAGGSLPELKTITEVMRERED